MFLYLQENSLGMQHIDPMVTEVAYNPKYEVLFAPQVISFKMAIILIDWFIICMWLWCKVPQLFVDWSYMSVMYLSYRQTYL